MQVKEIGVEGDNETSFEVSITTTYLLSLNNI